MKLVRSFAFLFVLLALALGAIPSTAQEGSAAEMSLSPWPCALPPGTTDATLVDPANAPHLLTAAEIAALPTLTSPPPATNPETVWAWGGMTVSPAIANEVVYAGYWGLPQNGAMTMGGGRGAMVTVLTGTVELQACGADGQYDTAEGDSHSDTIGAGSSTYLATGSSVYIFLSSGPATYWLFGTPDAGATQAVVQVQVVGYNGAPQTCSPTTCSVAPFRTDPSGVTSCADLGCEIEGPPGGCGGIRCWVP